MLTPDERAAMRERFGPGYSHDCLCGKCCTIRALDALDEAEAERRAAELLTAEQERALSALGTERNTWARQLADATDERDTARVEAEDWRVKYAGVDNEIVALETKITHPSDEVVEAVDDKIRTLLPLRPMPGDLARAAIAALADAGYVVAPRQYHTRERAIERVADALRAEGFTENGGNPHSWRCEHPDRYPDYCHCVTDLAETALAALADAGYSVVRLPERAEPMDPTIRSTYYCLGWNACLDKIEQLSEEDR